MLKTEFIVNDYEPCLVKASFGQYVDPYNIAIILDTKCEGLYGYPTVNLNGLNAENYEVAIDINKSPKAEMYLKDAGYIEQEPIRYIASGWCKYPVYTLTEDARKAYDKFVKEELYF